MLRKTFIAASFALFTTASSAEELDNLRNVTDRICPADTSNYNRIDDKCNPGDANARACDRKYDAPSTQWQACYNEISACHKRVEEANRVIFNYNIWMNKCRAADKQSRPDSASADKSRNNSTTGNDLDSRLARQNEKAKDADTKNAANLQKVLDAANKAVSARDKEIQTERAEVTRRQREDAANRAKVQQQIESDDVDPAYAACEDDKFWKWVSECPASHAYYGSTREQCYKFARRNLPHVCD